MTKLFLCIVAAHSSIAQSVEQLAFNQLVAGSSPARGAKIAVRVDLTAFFLP